MRLLRATLLLTALASLPVFAQHPSGGGPSGSGSSGSSSSGSSGMSSSSPSPSSSPSSESSSRSSSTSSSSSSSSSGGYSSSGSSSGGSSSHSSSSSSSSSGGSYGRSSSGPESSYSHSPSNSRVDREPGSRSNSTPDFSRNSGDRQDRHRGVLNEKTLAPRADRSVSDRRDLDRRITDQSTTRTQIRADRENDRRYDKWLNHETKRFDSDIKKLDRFIFKSATQEEKQVRKERRGEEKRERAARKLEAKLQAKQGDRSPRGPVKPLPSRSPRGPVNPPSVCSGSPTQGECVCANGTLSSLSGGCTSVVETQIATLSCLLGEYRDGSSGRCLTYATSQRNCSLYSEILNRLESQRMQLESIMNEECSRDPDGGRCAQFRSEYRGILAPQDTMRRQYEQCRRSL